MTARKTAVASLVLLAACADVTLPRAASPSQLPSASSPHTLNATDAAAEYGMARIYNVSPLVYWQGSVVNASASMDYWGNSADQVLTLTLSKATSQVYTREAKSHEGYMWPDNHTLTTPGFTAAVSGTCGHVANLASHHVAKVVFIVDIQNFTELSTVETSGGAHAAQPNCASSTCTSTVSNDEPSLGGDFDPYLPDMTTNCDGGAGSGTSGGTQYGVGDYTGGQTVDWKTGKGTGKPSECGDQARVDYICVEYDTGFGWKSLGCGYITTC
jgi:hypothetical protein